jgi:hypothetical protein
MASWPMRTARRKILVGETRVDLLHLLEDLADAYPGDLEETILTEIVANALDSGASAIAIGSDPPGATFTVIDNGRGMRRAELRRFHDIAASTRNGRGHRSFRRVGIKLGLLVSEGVHRITARKTTSPHRGRWPVTKRAPQWVAPAAW